MYCINCGTHVPAAAKFCPACGVPVSQPSLSQSSTAPQQNSEEAVELPSEIGIPPDQTASLDKGCEQARKARSGDASASSQSKPVISRLKYINWAFIGLATLLGLHTLIADRPFWFLLPVPETVNQSHLAPTVVSVVCQSSDQTKVSTGSGIMVLPEGIVLTNAHIIPHDAEYLHTPDEGCVVTLPEPSSGKPSEIYWAKPIVVPGIGDEYDLAHLRVYAAYHDYAGHQFGNYPRKFSALYDDEGIYVRACGVKTDAHLGDPIRIFGYPAASGGYTLTVTDGIVSSYIEGGLVATSAKVDAGNSGGLAVDKHGCFVGIPSAVLRGRYENLGVIIPTRLIREYDSKVQAKK